MAGKDGSRWPSHYGSVQGEVDSDQHVAALGPVSQPDRGVGLDSGLKGRSIPESGNCLNLGRSLITSFLR